ncbi:hypothetical protein Tco_1220894 [Tanacetum coccineum]
MANLSADIQCASSDTQPPMLDRTDFASWQQRIRLYYRGKENGVNILKSIDEGLFQMGTFRETLAERNEGLPKDIYTLINHYTDEKDIWDNVKMLLEGSELTKEDRESQLYDDFEQFRQNKGETIHDYYVRFVTAVKLNRGLKESNYDQLYAYLNHHEAHANENKMMLERFTQHTIDPLALMSNISPQQYSSQSSTTPPSTHVSPVTYQPHFADNTQLDPRLSPTDNLIENLTNTLALLTQSYKTYLPQTKFCMIGVDRTEVRGTIQEAQVQLVMEGFRTELGMKILVKLDILSVITAMENGVVLDEEQLLFLAGGHDTAVNGDVDEPLVQDLTLNVDNVFQADECDAFDSDVDEAPTTQTMFMANLSSADPVYDEAAHEMHHYVQPNYVVDSNADYTSDINMISYDQYVKGNAEPVVQSNVSSMPNDAYMTIINEMHKQTAQSVYVNEQNKVVNASLTIELANIRNKLNCMKDMPSLN